MKPNPDNQWRKRIAEALLSDDPSGFSDREIERALDGVTQTGEATELTDIEIGRILLKMRRELPVGERIPDTEAPAPYPAVIARKSTEETAGSPRPKVEVAVARPVAWWRSSAAISSLAALWIIGIGFVALRVMNRPHPTETVTSRSDGIAGGAAGEGISLDDSKDLEEQSIPWGAMVANAGTAPLPQEPADADADNQFIAISFATGNLEKKRIELEDGSILYVNADASGQVDGTRRITLEKGEIYVDVAPRSSEDDAILPGGATFVVNTPDGEVSALGTKFGVHATRDGTGVLVTQGTVRTGDIKTPLRAGQEMLPGPKHPVTPSRRAAEALHWLQDLEAEAHPPAAPANAFLGGVLIAHDSSGRQRRINLSSSHIDVVIENGFAETTIDQTYTSDLSLAVEAVFYFPVPPDAAVTRFATSAGEEMVEADIVPREPGRIAYREAAAAGGRPGLMEWQDASTFSMRIFPLEPGAEKRVRLSFTRRLDTDYGRTQFRLAGVGDTQLVGNWSTKFRVSGGARNLWDSSSHNFEEKVEGPDLILTSSDRAGVAHRDIVVNLYDQNRRNSIGTNGGSKANFSTFDSPTGRYLMVRHTPDLGDGKVVQRRDWIFLYENSADRNILEAKTASGIIRGILENVGSGDDFSIVAVGTRSQIYGDGMMSVAPGNLAGISNFLNGLPRLGALNVESGFSEASRLARSVRNPVIVHLGSGIPVLGERNTVSLLERLPDAPYVGIGIGPRWNRPLMKAAAGRTGGFFTQLNPDEPARWRAFDILSTLNAPRLLDVEVSAPNTGIVFATFQETLAQGEELCAIAKLPSHAPAPTQIAVHGLAGGEEWHQVVDVSKPEAGGRYISDLWARLEVDRLVAYGGGEDQITAVSLTHRVLSPYTSFLTTPDSPALRDGRSNLAILEKELEVLPRERVIPEKTSQTFPSDPVGSGMKDSEAEGDTGNKLEVEASPKFAEAQDPLHEGGIEGEAESSSAPVAPLNIAPDLAAPSSGRPPGRGPTPELMPPGFVSEAPVEETGELETGSSADHVSALGAEVDDSSPTEKPLPAGGADRDSAAGKIVAPRLSQVRLQTVPPEERSALFDNFSAGGVSEAAESLRPDDYSISDLGESDRVETVFYSGKLGGLLYSQNAVLDLVDIEREQKKRTHRGEIGRLASGMGSAVRETAKSDNLDHVGNTQEEINRADGPDPAAGRGTSGLGGAGTIAGGAIVPAPMQPSIPSTRVSETENRGSETEGVRKLAPPAEPSEINRSPRNSNAPGPAGDHSEADRLDEAKESEDGFSEAGKESGAAEVKELGVGTLPALGKDEKSPLVVHYHYWKELADRDILRKEQEKGANSEGRKFGTGSPTDEALDSTLEFARDNPGNEGALVVLNLAARARTGDATSQKRIADAYRDLKPASPQIAYASRYESARALLRSGDASASRDEYADLYDDYFDEVPPFDRDLPLAFDQAGDIDAFYGMIRAAAEKLLSEERFGDVVAIAWQCQETGHRNLADELLELIAKTLPAGQGGQVASVALQIFGQSADDERSAEVLGLLIGDGAEVNDTTLLRRAAEIAQNAGKRSLALDWLGRALALDYERRDTAKLSAANGGIRSAKGKLAALGNSRGFQPDMIRRDYGRLLELFRDHAAAMKTLEVSTPRNFSQRVIEAAESWRALDPDPAAACSEAAEVFTLLGENELAWDYITTPLANAPNDATGWRNLATRLKREGLEIRAAQAESAAESAESGTR